jgi:hypothetical protein
MSQIYCRWVAYPLRFLQRVGFLALLNTKSSDHAV